MYTFLTHFFTFNVFKSTLTETVFSRTKNPQENAIKTIRANKVMLKTEGKLYRNNPAMLDITNNRLGRKFFQVGSVIPKTPPTHLPVIPTN